MKRCILGISRSTQFSPHSEDRDAAIFAAVASRLNRGQNDVSVISEDLFIAVDLTEFDFVFSMARGCNVLESLALAEKEQSLKVINSPSKLLCMSRANIAKILQDNALPVPQIKVGAPAELMHIDFAYPCWIKRADACAQGKNDVVFVENAEQMQTNMDTLSAQGVKQLVVEQHLTGDLVKFYGVEGTDFFSVAYPTENGGFSKFGLEKVNGTPNHFAYSKEAMKEVADKVATLTGITVYGGDAIVQADGSFNIIDFNDWPSFASCRKDAAKAIAKRINSMLG